MKYAIVTLSFMISTVATVALAEDGGGHGPPKAPIIITPLPTPTLPTKPLSKLFQPTLRLESMTK
jgi:hypothetical protein